MYAEPNWGMDNIKRHKDCPFRTKLANCDAVGGFCTSVNETICEGIHKALNMVIEALQDDWIPFNDDSAAPNYEVICQDRYENMMLGYAWVDNYGIWMCEDDNTIMDDVVAWRPLPKPYKESEQ